MGKYLELKVEDREKPLGGSGYEGWCAGTRINWRSSGGGLVDSQ
jgi:hypothetical protein